MTGGRFLRRMGWGTVWAALAMAGLSCALSLGGVLLRADLAFQDLLQRLPDRGPSADVALVVVDEESLDVLGSWPWPRSLHAQLVDALHSAGARAVGLDIIVSERQHPLDDQALADAMARSGRVVLPVLIERQVSGQLQETLPFEALARRAAALGMVHADADADGILRGLYLREGLGRARWSHLVQAMVATGRAASPDPDGPAPEVSGRVALPGSVIERSGQRTVRFLPGAQPFVKISAHEVLSGRWDPQQVRGKWVLVGAEAVGLMDRVFIPVASQPVAGVEFLAHALDATLHDRLVRPVAPWVQALLAACLALLPWLFLHRLGPRSALWLCAGLLLAALAVQAALFWLAGLAVSTMSAALGIALAYPLWSWRNLERVFGYLSEELQSLQTQIQNLQPERTWTEPSVQTAASNRLEQALQRVKLARAALHDLEVEALQTQQFISHDIRLPLGSALMQLTPMLGADHPALQQIDRVRHWAEDFLQTVRAQQIRPVSHRPLDLAGLLHQAADEVHPMLAHKRLSLQREIPEDVVWVGGHFDLLLRAVLNLLSNALRFAPPGSVITLRLAVQGGRAQVSVQDEGPGIAEHLLPSLFQRYARAGQEGAPAVGAGLGLFFVKTVVLRHGGQVQARSQPGCTVLSFWLKTVEGEG